MAKEARRQLTPDLAEALCTAFEQGSTHRDACALNHLSPRTFWNWMAKGEAGHENYVAFATHVRAAEARWSSKLLADLQAAQEEGRDTKTLQWLLEKRRWKDYDPRALLAHKAAKAAREAAAKASAQAMSDEALQDEMISMLREAAKSDETLRAKLAKLTEEDSGGVEES